jgi:hypothetical protein
MVEPQARLRSLVRHENQQLNITSPPACLGQPQVIAAQINLASPSCWLKCRNHVHECRFDKPVSDRDAWQRGACLRERERHDQAAEI